MVTGVGLMLAPSERAQKRVVVGDSVPCGGIVGCHLFIRGSFITYVDGKLVGGFTDVE